LALDAGGPKYQSEVKPVGISRQSGSSLRLLIPFSKKCASMNSDFGRASQKSEFGDSAEPK
jgi:hypothetical protein